MFLAVWTGLISCGTAPMEGKGGEGGGGGGGIAGSKDASAFSI